MFHVEHTSICVIKNGVSHRIKLGTGMVPFFMETKHVGIVRGLVG
jgi:hypothetical protein